MLYDIATRFPVLSASVSRDTKWSTTFVSTSTNAASSPATTLVTLATAAAEELARPQSYKTFYVRNLEMFLIIYYVCEKY
jgi:hypothetical protein